MPYCSDDHYDCRIITMNGTTQHSRNVALNQNDVPNIGIIIGKICNDSIKAFADRFKKKTILLFIMAHKNDTSIISMLCYDVVIHVLRLIY